ncbi:hypothetical protein [Staphylococcus phage vB_SauH_DELF3]|nr:hypothetical protein [Staphylococcus phage vB_SauH_DELF3]
MSTFSEADGDLADAIHNVWDASLLGKEPIEEISEKMKKRITIHMLDPLIYTRTYVGVLPDYNTLNK